MPLFSYPARPPVCVNKHTYLLTTLYIIRSNAF